MGKHTFIGHGFSSRLGGVSEGSFASLNLSHRVGDFPGAVNENLKRFLGIWEQTTGSLVCGEQVHGTSVFSVEENVTCNDSSGKGRVIPAVDALVTAVPGVVLGALSADCLISFF